MLCIMSIIAFHSASQFKKFYLGQITDNLLTYGQVFSTDFSTKISDTAHFFEIDSLCKTYGRTTGTRITVVDISGRVLGDTDNDPAKMENHSDRPEIHAVISGREESERQRYSATMRRNLRYVAMPLHNGSKISGVLRLSVSVESLNLMLSRYYAKILSGALLLAVIAALASYLFSRRISRPVEVVQQGAMKFAAGDLTTAMPVPKGEEMAQLARTLNQMASQLNERIETITRQREERDAVLSSMTEGVIALDTDKKILMLNRASTEMFGVESNPVNGKKIHEVIRSSALEKFIKHTLESSETVEGEIEILSKDNNRILQAHGTLLNGDFDKPFGILLVLNDITAVRRLENIRKDFVDNASHELRTPLTAVKGFVETLVSNAYSGKDDLNRFLGIISSKVDRLCNIVDDLLTLSRIEKENSREEITLETILLSSVVESAVETCRIRAAERSIKIQSDCAADIKVHINPSLMEQALVNLIDNAVKYSDDEKSITVSVTQESNETVISVQDHGIGIEKEHLDRLFERFYRVDKARSRKMGGSGLGLSIVKNIASAHKGKVTVQSTPSVGSTFKIHLPGIGISDNASDGSLTEKTA
jgi:two-component system phosphate regulon sensor histidine kinase PhoR